MTQWIRTPEELDRLAEALAGCPAIALDTESDSLHHYAEKVCLVQLASLDGRTWLVDPLAVRDLGPLGAIIGDPRVLKVLHGADYDIATLRRDFGWQFRSLFDTQVAARLCGETEFGLQALVRRELGVELHKGNQKDDWSERPLTPQQERYALADVEHLVALCRRLTERLAAMGRTAWAREEFEALTHLPAAQRRQDPEAYRRIKGASGLPSRGLAVLRELHAWRVARAERTDVPEFKIVGNEVLLELAARPSIERTDVERALARYSRLRGEIDAVLAAVQRGLALPEPELPPESLPTGGRRPPAEVRRRIDALRAWRAEQAGRVGLDVALVLPQRLVEAVAEAAPRTLADLAAVDGIRRWRVDAWGPAILAAM